MFPLILHVDRILQKRERVQQDQVACFIRTQNGHSSDMCYPLHRLLWRRAPGCFSGLHPSLSLTASPCTVTETSTHGWLLNHAASTWDPRLRHMDQHYEGRCQTNNNKFYPFLICLYHVGTIERRMGAGCVCEGLYPSPWHTKQACSVGWGWEPRPVVLNPPNAMTLEFSSSWCGDPQPQNYFIVTS